MQDCVINLLSFMNIPQRSAIWLDKTFISRNCGRIKIVSVRTINCYNLIEPLIFPNWLQCERNMRAGNLTCCLLLQDNGREALDLTASPLRAPPAPNNRTQHPPPMVIQGDFRKVTKRRLCNMCSGTNSVVN